MRTDPRAIYRPRHRFVDFVREDERLHLENAAKEAEFNEETEELPLEWLRRLADISYNS